MAGIDTADLTAIGALATALITGAILVVGIVGYRHTRHQAGLRRPIRVRAATRLAGFKDLQEDKDYPVFRDNHPRRYLTLHVANRSDVDVDWWIDTLRTRVFRLARGDYSIDNPGRITTDRHHGYNMALAVKVDESSQWRRDERDEGFMGLRLRRKCWVRFRGETADGHKVKALCHAHVWEIALRRDQ